MKRLTLLVCAVVIAACGPQKPAPEPVVQVEKKPQVERFDGLFSVGRIATPERDGIRDTFRYDRSLRMTNIKGLRYYYYQPDRGGRQVVGFSFENKGSQKVNPVGLRRPGARREYAFLFADRARENIHLAINDDVKLSGRFSHDNMFREIHFFPRRQLPTLSREPGSGVLKVTLPTGEPVLFDEATMEITGGALMEGPIDFNRSRHHRRNPEVRYRGDYLAITVAQRGEAPRRDRVWGQEKFAEVHYPARYDKPCRISPKLIWNQKPKPGDVDPTLEMLHHGDEALFDTIERKCRWNLADLREAEPILVEAEQPPTQ